MSTTSTIEWTDTTWNPVVGCKKVSPGCAHCYAETMSARQAAMCLARNKAGKRQGRGTYYMQVVDPKSHKFNGSAVVVPGALEDPYKWKKPRRVFVNSMSDLFHENVSDLDIARIFTTMEFTHRHTYQVLTKRPERMLEWKSIEDRRPPAPNVWLGTSVENRKHGVPRIDILRRVPSAVRFLSIEPLLEDLGEIDLTGIHWVIVGGESGPGFRPMQPDWARNIRDQCMRSAVPFFFKQWGGARPKAGGRELDGRTWDEMPKPNHHTERKVR